MPFFEQDLFQCGPASLAMVLNDQNIQVTPDELKPLIYIPDRGGSLQSEMRSSVRQYGVITLLLNDGLKGLIEEVAAGNPVLVMQNLGLSFLPQWHYAVVIGYDLTQQQIILRSGRNRRHTNSFRVFMNTWRRSQMWGLIIPSNQKLPTHVNERDFLNQVSALEQRSNLKQAELYYTLGTERWPDNALIHFGLGNVYYNQNRLVDSEVAFRTSIEKEPTSPWAWNNLAQVLKERGCNDLAKDAELCSKLLEKEGEKSAEIIKQNNLCRLLPLCPN